MPPSTAWRRRYETTPGPRRASSPARPRADSIERLSPDPPSDPTTPTTTAHNTHTSGRMKREVNGHNLQGLGLSHTALNDLPRVDPDHLYLDSNGRAHVGATKLRSPKNNGNSSHDHTMNSTKSARANKSRPNLTQYRGPPRKSHVRAASAMSIDDLANIAIATSPQFNNSNSSFQFAGSPVFHSTSRPNTSYINGYTQDSFDRPAKRIKSERSYPVEWSQHDERPHSSHTYQSEIRQEDAELLLSL